LEVHVGSPRAPPYLRAADAAAGCAATAAARALAEATLPLRRQCADHEREIALVEAGLLLGRKVRCRALASKGKAASLKQPGHALNVSWCCLL
jgi:hypothetical protein